MSEVRFGAYRVVETLGTGAVSTIYKAVQEPLGRTVALKALKTQIAPTSSFADQIEREAKILADLAHPNVVLLLDQGRGAGGRPFLVLEHVDGPPLAKVLAKKKRLPVEVALAVARQLCAALEHAHERGVVHRDVKPTNVLLSTSGIVKLVDFGISQRARTAGASDALGAEGITPSGRFAPEAQKDAFGTPAYMSPEQILGDYLDQRSDLFSLGVVLYQMLGGSRPFEAPGEEGARPSQRPPPSAQRIRRDTPAPLRERAPNVPRTVERIVMRLLEKSPDDRYPDAASVGERLDTALRAITRAEPSVVVRAALADAGFIARDDKAGARTAAAAAARVPLSSVRAALVGQLAVVAVFGAGLVAIEVTSASAREGAQAGGHALVLQPERAGGLRVVATPWAYVRVDGQDVETTPFARPIPLPEGKHWVTLTHPGSATVEREVAVAAGETVTIDVTMPLGELDAGRDAR